MISNLLQYDEGTLYFVECFIDFYDNYENNYIKITKDNKVINELRDYLDIYEIELSEKAIKRIIKIITNDAFIKELEEYKKELEKIPLEF